MLSCYYETFYVMLLLLKYIRLTNLFKSSNILRNDNYKLKRIKEKFIFIR